MMVVTVSEQLSDSCRWISVEESALLIHGGLAYLPLYQMTCCDAEHIWHQQNACGKGFNQASPDINTIIMLFSAPHESCPLIADCIVPMECKALNFTAGNMSVDECDTHERILRNAYHSVAERLSGKSWLKLPPSGSAVRIWSWAFVFQMQV